MIYIETTLDCNTGIDAAIIEVADDDLTQSTEDTATDLTIMHLIDHITDHPNIESLQVVNPKVIVGHVHTPPTAPQGMNLTDQIHTPAGS